MLTILIADFLFIFGSIIINPSDRWMVVATAIFLGILCIALLIEIERLRYKLSNSKNLSPKD